jgi:thiol-disulfide isomerase/thioredoxin
VASAVRRKALIVLGTAAALFAAVPLMHRAGRDALPFEPLSMHASPRALPELRFTDARGTPTSLAAFRGRVVLLNVWATWCPPCREEMPTLDRLQGMLGGPDFEVVTLSIDRGGLPAVQAFFREIGVKHLRPYVDTSAEAQETLGLAGIPLTLLIDREGRELGRKVGPAQWDAPQTVQAIRAYLGRPAGDGSKPRDAR